MYIRVSQIAGILENKLKVVHCKKIGLKILVFILFKKEKFQTSNQKNSKDFHKTLFIKYINGKRT